MVAGIIIYGRKGEETLWKWKMIKCIICGRITKPKESTANMEYRERDKKGNLQIVGQKRMCVECFDEEKEKNGRF